MKYLGEEAGQYVSLKVDIQNPFLRLFAPSLKIQYDPKTRHLLKYEGLSNIPNDNGKIQNVTITYDYEPTIKKN
jgi:hypothetical protein